ncbi:hypothetical protein Q5H92_10700 [Hymenobacter sp. M29]|uniref:Uncharacterized protein n=1 Tax=Hymenobacter mellowenesis TaxID=3063995 RepID=A0ABT9ABP2_9BACT|nr:hypothetical protein [Hymenobacter sp. M29]MDO7846827.1 hypothetical protein [Hymenobacter sp. M29]
MLAGQVRPRYDHLEPAPSYFDSYNFQHTYYQAVRDVLCAGLPDDPLARVFVRRSFEPEYVLSLEEKDRRYYLTYRVCRRSIWVGLAEKNRRPVPVHSSRVPLRQPVALGVAQAFNAAIRQSRYPAAGSQSGMDGTQYTFTAFQLGIGMRGGETWSPRPQTPMWALVELQKTLRLVALTPTNGLLQEKLLQQAQQLLPRLSK